MRIAGREEYGVYLDALTPQLRVEWLSDLAKTPGSLKVEIADMAQEFGQALDDQYAIIVDRVSRRNDLRSCP